MCIGVDQIAMLDKPICDFSEELGKINFHRQLTI